MNLEQFYKRIAGKKIALCGVGRTHLPLIRMFQEKGAIVTVRDRRSEEELLENADIIKLSGAILLTGESYLDDLNEDIIFRTPGMKYLMPEFQIARENGQVVTSEMEVFLELCPCKIYAITGSDGKTTTTMVISKMLEAEGKTVHLGGNIGNPLLHQIESVTPEDVAVVELSSFQLQSMRNAPDVTVITNLSPNHLDYHKDYKEYVEAKKNSFLHQNAFSKTVLNWDDKLTRSFASEIRGTSVFFSLKENISKSVTIQGQNICLSENPVMPVSDIILPGTHNLANYMAAIAAVSDDVSFESMRKVALTFAGVPHRMEFVCELRGVKYYNDSIASSPTRTLSGTLSVYQENIILIAGGYDKHIPFDALGPVIRERVKLLILMGETGPLIEKAVREASDKSGSIPAIRYVDTMDEAVLTASNEAVMGDIVALSPASAAFGLYPDFEYRGRHFKELVQKLT